MRLNKRVGFDPSARAFAVAAKLTNTTQLVATNNLVLALKQQGLWPLITLLYPFVGGTAAAHSVNLKSPLTNPVAWTEGAVHSNLGSGGSTIAAYGNTNLLATQVPVDMGIYVTAISGGEDCIDFGAATGINRASLHYQYNDPAWIVGDLGSHTAPGCRLFVSAPAIAVGGFLSQGRVGQIQSLYKNGQVINTSANASNVTAPNAPFVFAGTRRIGAAFVGAGFTAPQHAALYNAIQAFQTALGRAA